jgi:glucose/arabinose dehydrogenase
MSRRTSNRRRITRRGVLLLAALTAVGATWTWTSAASSSPARPATRVATQLDAPSTYKLTVIGKAEKPLGVIYRAGDDRPFVIEKVGTLRVLTATGDGAVVLDISKEVSDGTEQGFLGAVFSNDGSRLYAHLTNGDGDTEIREYQWSAEGNAADPATKRLVLTVKQPYGNHNGGHLVMDSTDLLWIGLGDGGSAGDPKNSGQTRTSLLGKILRIDPRPSGTKQYSIPSDNPWASGSKGAPEVWAWGLRNPWRFEVDEPGKRVIIGDVGQNVIEEMNVVPLTAKAPNFGWKPREGKKAYEGGKRPAGAIDPVWEMQHSKGWCSVTGGVTYRGNALPRLRNVHVFADYCKGELMGLEQTSGGAWKGYKLNVDVKSPSAFSLDRNGDVLVMSLDGDVSRLVAQ